MFAPAATLSANPEQGNCSLQDRYTAQRIDWLSALDIGYRGFGLHASADTWYDARYPNAPTDTSSAKSGEAEVQFLDLFLYGTTAIADDQQLSFRLGRHTLLWGESLYFTANGIAAGQAPRDAYVYQTAASYQTGNSFVPVGQASVSWQPRSTLAIDGYYQFQWRRDRVNLDDAYASATDILEADNERSIGLTVPGLGPVLFRRSQDQTPGSSDQYGAALKWQHGDFDYGFYGLSFNAKTPVLYFHLPARPSAASYTLEYPKGIEIYGMSVAGPLGDATFGAEISGRRNMPLVNAGIILPQTAGLQADNNSHPLYPLGDTAHAQASWSYQMPPLPILAGGANWTGEIAANSLLATTANANQLVPGRTRVSAALRTVFEPQFFQVLPRLDITTPIGLGYNFLGLSEVDPTMNRGTGDISGGITATFDQVWKGAVNLVHYLGTAKNGFVPFKLAGSRSSLAESDFIAVSVQRAF